ncbi:MAG: SHOCT domain-containing protein [Betaproteobacteria bacterium]|nr:SHOCT domain-containing protein [Betaproteobacteria bacterium]
MYYGHMYGFGHAWMLQGGLWSVLAWLWMAFMWLVPILLLAALLKYLLSASRRDDKPRSKALDLLDEAYARGELARDDYLRKRADLERKD